MSLTHVPAEIARAEFNGILCARALQTYAKGTNVQTVIDGTATAEMEVWTSDGSGVHTGHWCDGTCGAEYDNAVYFERTGKNHAHGWACGKCRKVTQTG